MPTVMGRAVGVVATVDTVDTVDTVLIVLTVAFAVGAKETISEAEVSDASASARGRDRKLVMTLVKW